MRVRRMFQAVDSHTEGMPTRVVTGGVGVIPGESMAQRRDRFVSQMDDIRRLLMNEPRGHAAMSGAILQPACDRRADVGVLYIEVSGCLPMCGHGTIGVATVLVETGMVEVREPVTLIRLDTPAGLVETEVSVVDGVAESVTLRNVASYSDRLDATVDVPGLGRVVYDLAYGGNFYAITDLASLGITFTTDAKNEIVAAGLAIMAAINDAEPPVHRELPHIRGVHHVLFTAPDADEHRTPHAMVIHPGWIDRSPCGTGTAARMAQLHARGRLPLGRDMVSESFIGSRFVGRLLDTTEVAGGAAVVPSITGRAWITGTAQYLLDPADPFPAGFTL